MPTQHPSDDIVRTVTIHASISTDGRWHVHCPEWKYHGHGTNLTRLITVLVAEIDVHNHESMMGEPMWYKNPKQLAECALGVVDHDSRQAQLFKRKRRPMPDDGKRTPGAYWQLPT